MKTVLCVCGGAFYLKGLCLDFIVELIFIMLVMLIIPMLWCWWWTSTIASMRGEEINSLRERAFLCIEANLSSSSSCIYSIVRYNCWLIFMLFDTICDGNTLSWYVCNSRKEKYSLICTIFHYAIGLKLYALALLSCSKNELAITSNLWCLKNG